MIFNRRYPSLSGLGAGAAPSNWRASLRRGALVSPPVAPVAPVAPVTPITPTKPAVPTPAEIRERARAFQRFTPPVLTNDWQALNPIAREEAQVRLEKAAQTFQSIYGSGSAGGSAMPGNITSEDETDMTPQAKARAAFITWLRGANPAAYDHAMQAATSGGLGETPPVTAPKFNWQSFINAAGAATTAVFQTKAQRDMLRVNIERAKAGLPPMDTSFAAPVIRTQFDVSPEIAAQLQAQASGAMRNVLLFGGGALVIFLLARRRR